jgi:hypothetical protein
MERSRNIPTVSVTKIVIIRNICFLKKFRAFVNINATTVVFTQFIARFANTLIRAPSIKALMGTYIRYFTFIYISAKPATAVLFIASFTLTFIRA